MTELEQFTKLLDSCGHKYEVDKYATFRVNKGNHKQLHALVHLVTVQGGFYDELYAYFHPETKELLEMQSHVALQSPAAKKMKDFINS